MMILQKKTLSRKYAHAFYNLYKQDIDMRCIERIRKIIPILEQHTAIFVYIQLGLIHEQKAKAMLKKLVSNWQLPQKFVDLTGLLYDDTRLSLLPDVLKEICNYYYQEQNMMVMRFESAQPLARNQVRIFSEYLAYKTGKYIMHTEHINEKLIAGVRLIGKTILWEYNIARQLRNLSTSSVMKKS